MFSGLVYCAWVGYLYWHRRSHGTHHKRQWFHSQVKQLPDLSPDLLHLSMQICITLFFCASITLRGVTVVNVDPYSLDFVALWLANVVVGSGLILVVSAILVWVPVYDGRLANERLGPLSVVSNASRRFGGTDAATSELCLHLPLSCC